ncbi:MAG: hypothetical protein WC124_09325, partial [Desulfoplanes sp.]
KAVKKMHHRGTQRDTEKNIQQSLTWSGIQERQTNINLTQMSFPLCFSVLSVVKKSSKKNAPQRNTEEHREEYTTTTPVVWKPNET